MDIVGVWEDAPPGPMGVRIRYKVGAEQLKQVPSLIHRFEGVFRSAKTAPVGPTHAVVAATGAAVCGINAERLEVLDQDLGSSLLCREMLGLLRRNRCPQLTRSRL